MRGNVVGNAGLFHAGACSGGLHELVRDQAVHAGNACDGADRRAVSLPAFAAGGGGDPPRRPRRRRSRRPPAKPPRRARRSRKSNRASRIRSFADGYRAAYATIYQQNDYAAAIEQLKALGRDDIADVANLIGYSYRKLGDYKLSQTWYERALKSDPNHVRTWQYYGLWQIEQGNRDSAQYHLSRIAAICGTACDEYKSLAAALEQPPGSGLVY